MKYGNLNTNQYSIAVQKLCIQITRKNRDDSIDRPRRTNIMTKSKDFGGEEHTIFMCETTKLKRIPHACFMSS